MGNLGRQDGHKRDLGHLGCGGTTLQALDTHLRCLQPFYSADSPRLHYASGDTD